MSWASDNWDFIKHRAGGWLDMAKDQPWRFVTGSFDPINTAVFNKVLGRDDEAISDWTGGPTQKEWQSASDAGINIGPRQDAHAISQIIGAFYGGQALGGLAGGAAGGGAGAASGPGAAASGQALGSTAGLGQGAVLGNSAGVISGGAMGSALPGASTAALGNTAGVLGAGGAGAAGAGLGPGASTATGSGASTSGGRRMFTNFGGGRSGGQGYGQAPQQQPGFFARDGRMQGYLDKLVNSGGDSNKRQAGLMNLAAHMLQQGQQTPQGFTPGFGSAMGGAMLGSASDMRSIENQAFARQQAKDRMALAEKSFEARRDEAKAAREDRTLLRTEAREDAQKAAEIAQQRWLASTNQRTELNRQSQEARTSNLDEIEDRVRRANPDLDDAGVAKKALETYESMNSSSLASLYGGFGQGGGGGPDADPDAAALAAITAALGGGDQQPAPQPGGPAQIPGLLPEMQAPTPYQRNGRLGAPQNMIAPIRDDWLGNTLDYLNRPATQMFGNQ